MRQTTRLLIAVFFICLADGAAAAKPDAFAEACQAMVDTIAAEVVDTRDYLDQDRLAPEVMAALGKVPRHDFVPAKYRDEAYENRPLPIGHGQTISQPYIVAIMTDLLKPRPDQRVLEIGTGSGYQAAVLAELVSQVYTIEIIRALGEEARDRLARLGYTNVAVQIGDGYYGWAEHAPFDAIVVTAAASHIPPPLVEQLKPGGRLIAPVGSRFMVQQLVLVEKGLDGELTTRQILPVSFVPLTGGH